MRLSMPSSKFSLASNDTFQLYDISLWCFITICFMERIKAIVFYHMAEPMSCHSAVKQS